ncbi:hypothetical protein [Acetobacter thailandicus]|uniref:Uncharacterized protein n=1 Tax=Acetobacter thailandicus TaxID=1502842 RepID=A0ABT3QCN1_9PROT|nr:hypothetical protein [Acetobacter thailandicus]MCX2563035.1 hypothetical protein [Acetobacter thailandicus]NHN96342.1 hypothetical protein [Acetobacter thailandicus]
MMDNNKLTYFNLRHALRFTAECNETDLEAVIISCLPISKVHAIQLYQHQTGKPWFEAQAVENAFLRLQRKNVIAFDHTRKVWNKKN